MDYRKFVGQSTELVLPYFGGPSIDALDRRLRVEPFEPPGWYRFKVVGRVATKHEPAEPGELSKLPKVRGWFYDGRLVREGAWAELLWLLPAEQPALFAKLSARRWPSGELLLDEVEFESEVEAQVRDALGAGQGLSGVKGVPAPLRSAFAYALLDLTAKRLDLRFAPAEVRAQTGAMAEGGPAAAEAALRRLEAERELARRETIELQRRQAEAAARREVQQERESRMARARADQANAIERATVALEAAGARLELARELGRGQLEVIFRFMDQRFISVVELGTLQVIDSGICLGHPPSDKLVTLDSLPSVIKEAIETDALVILRWP